MPPVFDRRANTHSILDNFHFRIHEGTAWSWTHRYEDVAAGATIDTIFELSAGEMHLLGQVIGGAAARVDFMAVSSFTNGTSIAPHNHNGEFASHISSAYFHHTASVNVVGAVIVETIVGAAGAAGKAAGGNTGDFPEFLLEEGIYAVRFTNVSNGAADFVVDFEWYEPTNIGTPSSL